MCVGFSKSSVNRGLGYQPSARLSGGKGSLAERASEKCIQEDLLAAQLGARTIKEKLNAFLWRDRSHVEVRELVEWCRKYLYLPRISTDQVILDALVNPQAAMTGEETFHLADSVDQASGRYSVLRPQEASSTQLPTLNSLVVKNEVALQQLEADRAARAATTSTPPATIGATGAAGSGAATSAAHGGTTTNTGPGNVVLSPPATPPKPQLPTRFVASVKLDSTRASLQMSTFMEEVMSHLQALDGADVEMTLEVQVKAPSGIDEQTARIVLANSVALKVDNPGLY